MRGFQVKLPFTDHMDNWAISPDKKTKLVFFPNNPSQEYRKYILELEIRRKTMKSIVNSKFTPTSFQGGLM